MNTYATILMAVCLAARVACGDVWQDLAKYQYGAGTAADEAQKLLQKTPVEQHGAVELSLIAVVSAKEATQDGKAMACRMLQQIGTEKCIPAVAGLLMDEVLSDYARLVLERIGSPKADAALRAALDTAPDKAKLGIIGSLGVRRDAQAVNQLAQLAAHSNPAIASAALSALGRIGSESAATSLRALKPAGSLNAVHMTALLDCARSVKGSAAVALYDVVLAGKTSQRIGALSGMLAVDEKKAVALMVGFVKSDDVLMSGGVLTLVCGEKSASLTKAMAEALGTLPDDKKAALITALGARGDNAALGSVAACLASTNSAVRDAALMAAGKIGDEGTVKVLLGMGDAATEAIARMPGSGVNETLVNTLQDSTLKAAAIRAIVARNCIAAVPVLFKLVSDSDADVRKAAWNGLGSLATEADIVPMAKAAFAIKDEGELACAVGAAKSVCGHAGDKAKCFDILAAYYDGTTDGAKSAIIGLGADVGTPSALAVVKKGMSSGNKELYRNAVRSLAAWCNDSVASELLVVAKGGHEEADRILALRGYIGIAGMGVTKENANQKAEMFKTAAQMAARADEKKLIVNSIRDVRTADTLNLVSGYMDDPALREEAEQAAVEMAWHQRKDGPAAEVKALAQKLLSSKNQDIVNRAKEILAETGK